MSVFNVQAEIQKFCDANADVIDIGTNTLNASGLKADIITGRTAAAHVIVGSVDINASDITPVIGSLTVGGMLFSAGTIYPKMPVLVKVANYTVTAADTGSVFIANAADLVFTLPSTVVGLTYTFVNAALSGGTGLSISPAAADNINEGTDNKDLINSGATDVVGDSVTIVGDGDGGWFTIGKIGTWAAEA
jgi:hypothetical protein